MPRSRAVSGLIWLVWKGSVSIRHTLAPQERSAQLGGIPADPSLLLCFASRLSFSFKQCKDEIHSIETH